MTEPEKKILREVVERLEEMEIKGVSIDSRNIREGELFVAIKGERFDGHDFVSEAMTRGAWGAMVERSALENNYERLGVLKNMLPVEDTLLALQEMSHLHRKKFSLPVVGITGSNGKTTTKEMLAGILKQKGPVLKNEGNLNNHIGVPLTLLKLDAAHKTAAIEMGMSGLGEIDLLARLTGPTVGVITNVGPAHLEFLETMDRIAQAKGELLENLQADGIAVLNADDTYYATFKRRHRGRTLSFGIDQMSDVRATDIRQGKDFTDFTITSDDSRQDVRLSVVGRHNIYNALAAATAAIAVGMPLEAVKYGLDGFAPVALRSEIKRVHGRIVFADCYNANPGSMDAALKTLVSLKAGSQQAVAVLGDMLELGAGTAEAHREVGRAAMRLGVDLLITMGTLAKHMGAGALDAGMPRDRVVEARSFTEAATLLKALTRDNDVVLVKGSRGMKMEKILEEF